MKPFTKPLAAIALAFAAAPLAVTPASAQIVRGIGVANLNAVVVNSSAYKQAETQRQQTYKAQIDAAEARRKQIAAQLDPLMKKFQADSQAANPNTQSLQQQARQIQQIEQNGQQELARMLQQVVLSRAYTNEQIQNKLADAMQAAAKKKNITLILDASQGDVLYAEPPYNLNQDIVNELNTLLPAVQIVPPQGWQPGGAQQQQAAPQAQGR